SRPQVESSSVCTIESDASSQVSTVHGSSSASSGGRPAKQPLVASQPSGPSQNSPSSQCSGVPGVHVPFWQTSSPLHTVPSGHAGPSGSTWCPQPTSGVHTSDVQRFTSAHSAFARQERHTPPVQCVPPPQSALEVQVVSVGSGDSQSLP